MLRSARRVCVAGISLALALCAAHPWAQSRISIDEPAARLTFPDGHMKLVLPIQTTGATTAYKVQAELVDPTGFVLSGSSGECTVRESHTNCFLEMPAVKDQRSGRFAAPLLRLRYALSSPASSLSGTLSLDHIAPELYELHLAGPPNLRAGSEHIVRVRAVHPLTHQPRANLVLKATLTANYVEDGKKDETFATETVTTDAEGFASLPVKIPAAGDLDTVDVEVTGKLANIESSADLSLNVRAKARFELTTDKPLYQPGQTVHTRLLVLDRSGHATGGRTVRVDISDPDDTLVFRAKAVTSRFGIASIDWPVPARMRLGEYELQADFPGKEDDKRGLYGEGKAHASIRISRYDLPTFLVEPKPDRPFYLPGVSAVVDVHADYLFGKPVPHGHVRVVRESERTWNFAKQRFDTTESQPVKGELDAKGHFLAHIDLSEDEKLYRSREPINAFRDIHFAAYVTDTSTGRTEQRRFDLRIASQALNVNWTGGYQQVRDLPVRGFLTIDTADGLPHSAHVTVFLLPQKAVDETLRHRLARAVVLQQLQTNSVGLARIELPGWSTLKAQTPPAVGKPDPEDDSPNLYFSASGDGLTGVFEATVQEPRRDLRVTAARSILRPGDPIDISLQSARPSLMLHVQVLRATSRGNITLATRDIRLKDGTASLSLPSDARFNGVIEILAIGEGEPVKGAEEDEGYGSADDPQLIFAGTPVLFPHDNALHVEIHPSRDTYAPGDNASASFRVRGPQDPDGEERDAPAPSALGIVAVDKAVEERNRSDSDFGGGSETSTFFFSPSLTGRNTAIVGGFTLASLQQLDVQRPIAPEAELAAEILLEDEPARPVAAENVAPENFPEIFKGFFDQQLGPLRSTLSAELHTHGELPLTQTQLAPLLSAHGIDLSALRDPWDDPYTVSSEFFNRGTATLHMHSAGPDKQLGTVDDFDVDVANWPWFETRHRMLQPAVEAYHQRTGGYIRNLPELRGELARANVDLTMWRDPWGHPFTYRFEVEETDFAIHVMSSGDTGKKPRYAWERGPYDIGGAKISYVTELRQRVDVALNRYVPGHGFPRNKPEFLAAMRAGGVTSAQLTDPWHRPLYFTFHSHSFFTDRAHMESHATQDGVVQNRTVLTPVTAVSDVVTLRSAGQDGRLSTQDDYTIATFSHVRSEQSAQETAGRKPVSPFVHVGETGNVVGTVVDPSGAAIPGVKISASALATSNVYECESDSEGRFVLGPVPPGSYRVNFRASGFMNLVVDSVMVQSRNSTSLDIKLNVGAAAEMVEVAASSPQLSTSSAMVTVNADKVSSLALAGRAVYGLLAPKSGVVPPPPPPPPSASASPPRLRNYFPETLLWRPEIITADDGTATLKFQLADNITAWHLSAAASTLEGNTGSGSTEFRTFQPFFASFDPPSVLTTGDTISLPVPLRNYLDHGVTVSGSLTPAPWFRVEGAAARSVQVPSQDSVSPVFRFTALQRVTEAEQEFTAQGADAGDRIARVVTVHPDGEERAITAAGILSPGDNLFTLALPADTLAGSSDTMLKLYPNLSAHLRDALVGMARYPDGCAEQILSIAWPSLLLQRYYAAIPGGDSNLKEQTHTYLQQAYENLLANQLSSGGFAYWQHDAHPDLALTAYAVEFLNQARQYVDVDDKVIAKAVEYLAHEQAKDGRWITVSRDGVPHPNDKSANAMLTASIASMIAGAPGADPLVTKAIAVLESFTNEIDEPYTLAGYALAALSLHDSQRSVGAIQRLRSMSLTENDGAYWSLETNTPFFGWGRAGRVETTALVLRALLASGATAHDDLVARGLLFLNHQRDRHFLWYSTQASARVLDVLSAIALTAPAASSGGSPGVLTVTVDGEAATSVPLPEAATDSGPIFVPLGAVLNGGSHRLTLTLPAGSQPATAQLVANFYHPWSATAARSTSVNNEQLRLNVSFGTTTPAVGKAVEATVHMERLGFRGYGMMIAEIGLPPGADVDRASLETAVTGSSSQINHYEVLPDKILLYVWPRAGGITLHFRFTMRYGVNALTSPSSVYDYYNPDARLDVAPTRFVSR